MLNLYDRLATIAGEDVATLQMKNKDYGSSWKKRGGVGAFMMLARKWDRIENLVSKHRNKWDIFEAGIEGVRNNPDKDGILDDITDLRCYLLLIEDEIREGTGREPGELQRDLVAEQIEDMDGEPGPGYTNPDRDQTVREKRS